jgi:hypothetical protein
VERRQRGADVEGNFSVGLGNSVEAILRSRNIPYSGPYTTRTMKLISENIRLKKKAEPEGL